MNLSNEPSAKQRIWQVVSQIPAGKVASYGQIAKLAGLPRAARLVGQCLKNLPHNTQLPWHRVINNQGRISLPSDTPAFEEQKRRLEQEGIHLQHNRVSMEGYRWRPDRD